MSIFYHEDEPPCHSKRHKFLATSLKDAFSSCHVFTGRPSTSGPAEDCTTSDAEDDQEVISEIRSRAMEKLKRRGSLLTDSFSTLVFSPSTGELYMTPKRVIKRDDDAEEKEKEDFWSAETCFSVCPSKEAFLSAKTNFSRCSSLNRLDSDDLWRFDMSGNFSDFRRRSIIQELCHCEGWPFGLCRKILLLPPLPKSPSDSWTWRKATGLAKTPYV